MNDDVVDENFHLARLVIQDVKHRSRGTDLPAILSQAERTLEKAAHLIEEGQKQEAIAFIMEAYDKAIQTRQSVIT